MLIYSTVYQRVDTFLQTREGLASPKNKQDYGLFLRELTGILCGVAYEHDLTTQDVIQFLDRVEAHEISGIKVDGKLHNVASLIDDDITCLPLFNLTEYILMYYKPGNVQVGPGEFFFCFYDCSSVFGIDNLAGYDIITDGVTTEFKKLGSNFTTPELFDKYAESPEVDRLMVVKPVSNAARPSVRSQYACIDAHRWRDAFTHTGKNGSLRLVT